MNQLVGLRAFRAIVSAKESLCALERHRWFSGEESRLKECGGFVAKEGDRPRRGDRERLIVGNLARNPTSSQSKAEEWRCLSLFLGCEIRKKRETRRDYG